MPIATDQQVQVFADARIRQRAQDVRALLIRIQDDLVAIPDIYEACNQVSPTWTDNRIDGPPHLLAPSDVLVYNTVAQALLKCIAGTATAQDVIDLGANWAAFQRACVQAILTS